MTHHKIGQVILGAPGRCPGILRSLTGVRRLFWDRAGSRESEEKGMRCPWSVLDGKECLLGCHSLIKRNNCTLCKYQDCRITLPPPHHFLNLRLTSKDHQGLNIRFFGPCGSFHTKQKDKNQSPKSTCDPGVRRPESWTLSCHLLVWCQASPLAFLSHISHG